MNERECFNAVMNFDKYPSTFLFAFPGVTGPFPELIEKWRKQEGIQIPLIIKDKRVSWPFKEYCEHFGLAYPRDIPVNLKMMPPFEYKILEDRGDKEVVQESDGIISLQVKNNIAKCSMPQFLKYPVSNIEDWEKLKERYQPDIEKRYPANWDDLVREYKNRNYVLGIELYGFFWFPREILGPENLMMLYYDEPEMVKDIGDFLADFYIRCLEKCFSEVNVDYVVIAEDMAYKNGPLISPETFRQFMMPYYKKLTDFCKEYGVNTILVDSDGDVTELIPLLIEAGVTGLMPFEVTGGMDTREVRRNFPHFQIYGGLDKLVLEEGKTFREVDKELEKVPELIKSSGYLPAPDHALTPQTSLKNFEYFLVKLREILSRLIK